MTEMVAQIREELTERIVPFWKNLRDDQNGGYIGQVEFDLTQKPEAERGCILNSRILWFFSEAYLTLKDPALLDEAGHAYQMLLSMLDKENGGVYWSMNADKTVADSTKHTYNQGFAIYALSAYYRASGNKEALKLAEKLFRLVEEKCFDGEGYLEAFTADWKPAGNDKLSENGVEAGRTMNTLLHILEGYTGLYEAGKDPEVRERLIWIMNTWAEKIYDPERRRQEVFFDLSYHTLIDLHSFGHDIETSWLADHTLDVLGDPALTEKIRPMLLAMADHTLSAAYTEGNGFSNESENGKVDTTRVWWVQAEALVGFLNAYEHTGEKRYLDAARSQWKYIKEKIIDPREGSEWFWSVKEDGTPIEKPIVEPWKCPYHNGRMCMEVIRRNPAL